MNECIEGKSKSIPNISSTYMYNSKLAIIYNRFILTWYIMYYLPCVSPTWPVQIPLWWSKLSNDDRSKNNPTTNTINIARTTLISPHLTASNDTWEVVWMIFIVWGMSWYKIGRHFWSLITIQIVINISKGSFRSIKYW